MALHTRQDAFTEMVCPAHDMFVQESWGCWPRHLQRSGRLLSNKAAGLLLSPMQIKEPPGSLRRLARARHAASMYAWGQQARVSWITVLHGAVWP